MALDKVEYYVDDEPETDLRCRRSICKRRFSGTECGFFQHIPNVSVKAYDKANNEATTASVDVLVSANTWVQFYNNKPAFYGTIGGGVAAVVAAVAAGVHFSDAAAGTAAAAGKQLQAQVSSLQVRKEKR